MSISNKSILNKFKNIDYPYTLAKVDNQYAGLNDFVPDWANIELLDLHHPEGRRTYERTLTFLLSYIAKKHNAIIKIEHSYGDALYGEVESGSINLIQIKGEMQDLIKKKVVIEKRLLRKLEAVYLLKERKMYDDLQIVEYLSREFITIYSIGDYICYFAGPLLPHAGFVKFFDLVGIENGFLVVLPSRSDPNKLGAIVEREKLLRTYNESKDWAEILNIWSVGYLNKAVISGKMGEIIKVSESFHEKKIAHIADEIAKRKENIKMILISGPSSSGKTTFSKRLAVQLMVNGLKPKTFSLDNYFVDREKTPLDSEGHPYFDALSALDLPLFNEHLTRLLNGEEVEVPKFNFKKGRREKNGKRVSMKPGEVLIIEGIHSLNPKLTESIDDAKKYKIYVSALTQLNINRVNRIPTRDVRLIRRIFRDTLFRGNPPGLTLERWASVVRGEEENIFPFQEDADIMFNSSLVYELAVLKNYVETPLRSVNSTEPYYCESLRLLNFLDHFLPITSAEIPPTSILREFIGGSSFRY